MMKNKTLYNAFIFSLLTLCFTVKAEVVVIASKNINLTNLDARIINRIYTGRIIELRGVNIIPVNALPGDPIRTKFLNKYLDKDEDKYEAYWTVRRFIGKGTPPKELLSNQDILDYIINTPGAIGYVETDKIEIPDTVKIIGK